MHYGLTPGLVLDDRYQLVRHLGSGATSSVWLARSVDGTTVACKVLHGQTESYRTAVSQLVREAEVLSQLSHPNIISTFEANTEGEVNYLVMEYADGLALHDIMGEQSRRGVHFSRTQICRLFGQLCEGVKHAHSKYIVHRDLKPQNVVVVGSAEGQRVKLLDFGHARLPESGRFDATTAGRMLGSPLYMSPEQIRGKPATNRSDIFAAATILFELVTLRRAWIRDQHDTAVPAYRDPVPAEGNNFAAVLQRIAIGPRPSARRYRPQLSTAFDRFLDAALAINPEDRPATVADLQTTALQLLEELPDEQGAIATPDFSHEVSSSDSDDSIFASLEPSIGDTGAASDPESDTFFDLVVVPLTQGVVADTSFEPDRNSLQSSSEERHHVPDWWALSTDRMGLKEDSVIDGPALPPAVAERTRREIPAQAITTTGPGVDLPLLPTAPQADVHEGLAFEGPPAANEDKPRRAGPTKLLDPPIGPQIGQGSGAGDSGHRGGVPKDAKPTKLVWPSLDVSASGSDQAAVYGGAGALTRTRDLAWAATAVAVGLLGATVGAWIQTRSGNTATTPTSRVLNELPWATPAEDAPPAAEHPRVERHPGRPSPNAVQQTASGTTSSRKGTKVQRTRP